jgi:hypothetical protein
MLETPVRQPFLPVIPTPYMDITRIAGQVPLRLAGTLALHGHRAAEQAPREKSARSRAQKCVPRFVLLIECARLRALSAPPPAAGRTPHRIESHIAREDVSAD